MSMTKERKFEGKPFRSITDKRLRVSLACEGGRTKQSFKDECDINNILKKYNKTGQLPDMIRKDARYGDFSQAPTYQEALDTVILAQEQFAALPAAVRQRFQNDPSQFLDFVHDPKNADELVKMELASPSKTAPNAPEGATTPSKGAGNPEGASTPGNDAR